MSPQRCWLAGLLLAAAAAGQPGPALGPAPDLELWSRGAEVEIDADAAAAIAASTVAYFESCHPSGQVLPEQARQQEELGRDWQAIEARDHLELRATGAADSRHADLRARPYTLVLALDGNQTVGDLLTETDDGMLASYLKCDGLDGLLLRCAIERALPAGSPSADCGRWRALRRAGP